MKNARIKKTWLLCLCRVNKTSSDLLGSKKSWEGWDWKFLKMIKIEHILELIKIEESSGWNCQYIENPLAGIIRSQNHLVGTDQDVRTIRFYIPNQCLLADVKETYTTPYNFSMCVFQSSWFSNCQISAVPFFSFCMSINQFQRSRL